MRQPARLITRASRSSRTTCGRSCEGRTALIIAHRLSTVRRAHRIITIEQRAHRGGRDPRRIDSLGWTLRQSLSSSGRASMKSVSKLSSLSKSKRSHERGGNRVSAGCTGNRRDSGFAGRPGRRRTIIAIFALPGWASIGQIDIVASAPARSFRQEAPRSFSRLKWGLSGPSMFATDKRVKAGDVTDRTGSHN